MIRPTTPRGSARDRRGFALVLAMIVLVVLGAIVGGTFFAGWLEQQIGENTLFAAQAAAGADGGLDEALSTISPISLVALQPGGAPLLLDSLALEPQVSVYRQISRLEGNLFLLTARAARRNAGGGVLARRAEGLLVHLLADSGTGGQIVVPLRHRAWVQLY
jgi:hypothetical protein